MRLTPPAALGDTRRPGKRLGEAATLGATPSWRPSTGADPARTVWRDSTPQTCPWSGMWASPDTTPPFFAGLIRASTGGARMNRTFKAAVAALMLAVGLAGSVAAGPFEDAAAAHQKGDYATVLRLMRPLAEQGDAGAQAVLGVMYDQGYGVPQDYAAAASWYRKAAEQGLALGQYNLGAMYAKGQGVPQDYAAAMGWYRTAAEQGLADAQNNVGAMYARGEGVRQDYAAAASWYRKAAEQGNAGAQARLGSLYATGEGVLQDFVVAHMWFNLAAARGHKESVGLRDKLAARMTPTPVAEAQKLAREWKPKTITAHP
jgi:TPR repeat protein